MGAKKQWTGKEKLAIVLQGLKGDCSISTLCNEHGITQGMYYKWRDSCCPMDANCLNEEEWIMSGNAWNAKTASSKKPLGS